MLIVLSYPEVVIGSDNSVADRDRAISALPERRSSPAAGPSVPLAHPRQAPSAKSLETADIRVGPLVVALKTNPRRVENAKAAHNRSVAAMMSIDKVHDVRDLAALIY